MTVENPDIPDVSALGGDANGYAVANDNAHAFHKQLTGQFAAHEQATPDMTVRVEAGVLLVAGQPTLVAAQDTTAVTAPSSNPRHDLVVLDPQNPHDEFRAHLAANQSVTSSTFTKIVFDTKEYDTANAYDTTTGEFTVPRNGTYIVSAYVHGTMSSGNNVACRVVVNGTSHSRVGEQIPGGGGSGQMGSSVTIRLNSGDKVTVEFFSAASSPQANGNPDMTFFSAARLY